MAQEQAVVSASSILRARYGWSSSHEHLFRTRKHRETVHLRRTNPRPSCDLSCPCSWQRPSPPIKMSYVKNGRHGSMFPLRTRKPAFSRGVYRLNFNGRVTVPSVKNFQLVSPDDESHTVCQFGKVHSYPRQEQNPRTAGDVV